MTSIRRKVKTITKRTHQSAEDLYLQLSRMVRGWALYFRHAASSKVYHDLQDYMWWRVWEWLKNKHPRTPRRWIIQRYYNGWWPEYNGVTLYKPTTMTIKRHRYRGARIPTPMDQTGSTRPSVTRGEPDAVKVARPVREGGPGKRARGNSGTAPGADPY